MGSAHERTDNFLIRLAVLNVDARVVKLLGIIWVEDYVHLPQVSYVFLRVIFHNGAVLGIVGLDLEEERLIRATSGGTEVVHEVPIACRATAEQLLGNPGLILEGF